MSETLIRIISGVVYAVLLLLAIFISEYTFLGLIFIFGLIALFELQQLLKLKSYLSFAIFTGFMVFFNVYHYLNIENIALFLMMLTLIVDVLLIRDLLLIRKIPLFRGRKYLIVIFYLVSGFVFLGLMPYQNAESTYDPHILLGVFILMWTNDSFAYLIGKTFGKRKLYERISPNKTIGGFIGGVMCTLLISYGVFYFTQTFSFKIWVSIALITSIFGTFGDLIQSKLKRQAGVKDSGRLMPGHGGLLDRLDSILFTGTFIYSYLVLVNHVS